MDEKYLEEVYLFSENLKNSLSSILLNSINNTRVKGKKFSNIEYAIKFNNFLLKFDNYMTFNKIKNEETAINSFLKSNDISDEEKEILNKRLKVLKNKLEDER